MSFQQMFEDYDDKQIFNYFKKTNLKEITKDLVKTDIEFGKNIVAAMGELKELRHRIELLERKP